MDPKTTKSYHRSPPPLNEMSISNIDHTFGRSKDASVMMSNQFNNTINSPEFV
jgi:hypothetical protein